MIDVADLLKLAAAGPEQLHRLGELGARLKALDSERADILAELAELGITETAAPERVPTQQANNPRNDPLCASCGIPATETLDGIWYCTDHGNEVLELANRPG